MENQSYFRVLDNVVNEFCVTDRHLAVNCTGCCVLPETFNTHVPAGRRDFYLQYMCGGAMRVWLPDGMHIMRAGEMIVYFPGTEYHYMKDSEEPVVYLWIHFSGTGAYALMEDCGIKNRTISAPGVDERAMREFTRLFGDFLLRDTCFETACAARLQAIFVALSRAADSVHGRVQGGERLIDSLGHIHKNYSRPLCVAALAGMEHMSESRYRTVFRASTGYSPRDYITALRIQRAQDLLSSSDLSVKEVAQAVGYTDALYFSRIFRKKTGASPTSLRAAGAVPASL